MTHDKAREALKKGREVLMNALANREFSGATYSHANTAIDMINDALAALRTPEAPEAVAWMDECATDGCENRAAVHFVRGDIGSNFCPDCYQKVFQLEQQRLTTPPEPVADPTPTDTDNPVVTEAMDAGQFPCPHCGHSITERDITAGYRLVGPGELDGETIERCRQAAKDALDPSTFVLTGPAGVAMQIDAALRTLQENSDRASRPEADR